MLDIKSEVLESINDKPTDTDNVKELIKLSGEKHVINIDGSTSLVQCTPWIMNKTVRDNILFGKDMNEERYNKVIECCQLSTDLKNLEGGDLTEIGEKGVNLSGGQKARVSLARAVYADSDIVLMDDPLSAVDANVKKKIFEKCFMGLLRNKTRMLITHAIDYLRHADRIIIMKDGRISEIGTYQQLLRNDELPSMLEDVGMKAENEICIIFP